MARRKRRGKVSAGTYTTATLILGLVIYGEVPWLTPIYALGAILGGLAYVIPVNCGCTTRAGHSCRNPVNGLLRTCSNHRWMKVRDAWRFLRRKRRSASADDVPAPAGSRQPRRPASGNVNVLITKSVVDADRGRSDGRTFVATVIGLGMQLVTTVVSVLTFVTA